ncbi:MAG: penicillin-binding protein 2 [Candidatus Aminicenantes bacterium]|nr:penicillin-binding protein 2 [Candidatus Aminicenantes bacterium]
MNPQKIYEDLSLISRRAQKTLVVIVILFVFLVLYFWKIQVLDHRKYWEKSENNRIREIIIPPQRGLIKARDGTILARNIGSYKVSIIRENCDDFENSLQKISVLLDLKIEELRERIDKYKSLPLFRPIVIKDNLTLQEVSRVEARRLEMPELLIQVEPKREYPFGEFASHILGYLQEISPQELQTEAYQQRRPGDLLGKTGIEQQYENRLLGTEGQLLEIVNSLGRVMSTVSEKKPMSGETVWLTLDVELQQTAEEILEGREGVVIVMDPNSGGILAWASYPNFDPNKFINRFTPEEWTDLRDNPDYPLQNRAIRGLYAPGSIFKLTMGLAALQSLTITESTSFLCNGVVQIYGQPRHCWYEPGHGRMNLVSAIKNSCNIFFYQTGLLMEIDTIAFYGKILGLGKKTGIDIPGEFEGLVPTREWKKTARNESWYPGETINVAIGQGQLMVTPLQVAVHTSIIANRGKTVTPYLVPPKSSDSEGLNDLLSQISNSAESINSNHFETVIKGAWMAVNDGGTAAAAAVPGFDVCGKTGSTQTISREETIRREELGIETKTHSWFTGFAPRYNPRVVVTILVEYGGGGGATAAPLSKKLFEIFKENYVR